MGGAGEGGGVGAVGEGGGWLGFGGEGRGVGGGGWDGCGGGGGGVGGCEEELVELVFETGFEWSDAFFDVDAEFDEFVCDGVGERVW